MKLWILKPIKPDAEPWRPWYDKAFGFVVAAKTAQWARMIAAANSGDEGGEAWTNAKFSSCRELRPGQSPYVVLRDYRSA